MSSKYAFPGSSDMSNGMTLRDYFAAQVLPQIFAMSANGTLSTPSGSTTQADIAKGAYAIADAMLAVRDAEPLPPPQQRSAADF
jgi:hypothetical protein